MRAERLLVMIFFVVSVVCAGARTREIGWRASGTGGERPKGMATRSGGGGVT